MEQARQTVAELNKILPTHIAVQACRKLWYDVSSNAQYRREVDYIADGLRKAGIREHW
jgi:hypothetical protein